MRLNLLCITCNCATAHLSVGASEVWSGSLVLQANVLIWSSGLVLWQGQQALCNIGSACLLYLLSYIVLF